ncbi:MAG: hypothetical protein EZS28_002145 [Streblomastix strix]|uniref:Uncharacterized protein n=1 Tax=Streblomastix strix TaxID=222440 RepID=A0A5J4X6P4_9EUKA|nr:MAG: hypothetical protein EZS28_002145 [Streblomastix strix]
MQALPEMYWWINKIQENKRLSLIWNIPQDVLVTYAASMIGELLWNLEIEKFQLYRTFFCTIENEGDSDQIGQLFDSIQSQKTEGSTTTSIWSQQSKQDNPTFGSIGINSTRSRSNQLHSRFTKQIGQLGRLQYKPTIGVNPISLVEPRANSGFIRKPIQCDPTSLGIDRPEGFDCKMHRSIQLFIGERNTLNLFAYPNDILDFNDTQTVINYSDCGGTLVTRPILVHNTAIRELNIDHPRSIEPNPDSGSEYDNKTSPPPTRQVSSLHHGYVVDRGHELLTSFLEAVGLSRHGQVLLIGGQKFQLIIRSQYAIATLDDSMKLIHYPIQDVLGMKSGFLKLES